MHFPYFPFLHDNVQMSSSPCLNISFVSCSPYLFLIYVCLSVSDLLFCSLSISLFPFPPFCQHPPPPCKPKMHLRVLRLVSNNNYFIWKVSSRRGIYKFRSAYPRTYRGNLLYRWRSQSLLIFYQTGATMKNFQYNEMHETGKKKRHTMWRYSRI